MGQNAHTYILYSTDYGITYEVYHPFAKGQEPLLSQFSAKSEEDAIGGFDIKTIDSIYYVTGDMPLNVQFFNYSIGDINIYEWDFDNDGIVDSNEESPIHTYSDTGWYSVNLTVYDGYDTNSFLRENYIYVYELTSTDNNVVADDPSFLCYPNPFKKETTVVYYVPHNCFISLKVYDVTGRLMYSKYIGNTTGGNHQYILHLPKAARGVYHIVLEVNGNPVNTKKIVVN